MHCRQLWLRGRARVLLSEGCWFHSPGLHVKVSMGKIPNPKLLLMCWLAPCMAATSVWMNYCRLFWTKRLLNVNVNAQFQITLLQHIEQFKKKELALNETSVVVNVSASLMDLCVISVVWFWWKVMRRQFGFDMDVWISWRLTCNKCVLARH